MIVIYHSQDLDGKSSGALAAMNFHGALCLGYHYNEPFNPKQLSGKEVLMIDVTFSNEMLMECLKFAKNFTIIDHHVSFHDKIVPFLSNIYTVKERAVTELIKEYTVPELNLTYYYSEKLSGCEMTYQLYPAGNNYTQENIKLLGQYDTWRNTDEKKFPTDQNWEVVMAHQFGFRTANRIDEVMNLLCQNPQDIYQIGHAILKYQKSQNEMAMKRHFVTEIEGLKIIACNGAQQNSSAFEGYYNEELHDAMMPFAFDGQNKVWNFSLYTTKSVDILSIAKNFGGGGHAQACGFQLSANMVNFSEDGQLMFGSRVIIDLDSLPTDIGIYSKEGFEKIIDEMGKQGIFLSNIKPQELINKVVEEPTKNLLSDEQDLVIPPATLDGEVKEKIKIKTKSDGKNKRPGAQKRNSKD